MDEKKVSTTRKLSRAMSREEIVKQTGGLSVLTATIFLAGEMAGSGALKLPEALVGSGILCEISVGLLKINKICKNLNKKSLNIFYKTGWAGVAIIFVFTLVSCYCGTRLGICANILAERFEEFRVEIRDPYPAMGFKAYGKPGR